jgi:drug/metabolite transporter (DMT)-like permease
MNLNLPITVPTARNRRYGIGLIFISAALNSMTNIASKQAMSELSPLAFMPIWFTLAALWGLGLYVWQHGIRFPAILWPVIRPLLWLGLCHSLANLLYFNALNLGDPTMVAFFNRSETLMTALLGLFILGEQLRPYQWGGIAIAVSGTFVMTYNGGAIIWWILGLMMVSNFLSSLGTLVVKQHIMHVSPLLLSISRTILMAVMVGSVTFSQGQFAWPSATTWGWLIGGAFFGPFLSFVAFYEGLRHLEMSTSSVIRATQPLFVALYSFMLFGTMMSSQQVLGGFILLLGIVLMVWRKK